MALPIWQLSRLALAISAVLKAKSAFDEIGYTMSSSNIAAESFAGLAWVPLSADPSPKGR
jgi:hypothetical protein